MTDGFQHRRRASDRARERASRAMAFGDHAAFVMATAQLEEAIRQRAAWAASSDHPGTLDRPAPEPVMRP